MYIKQIGLCQTKHWKAIKGRIYLWP